MSKILTQLTACNVQVDNVLNSSYIVGTKSIEINLCLSFYQLEFSNTKTPNLVLDFCVKLAKKPLFLAKTQHFHPRFISALHHVAKLICLQEMKHIENSFSIYFSLKPKITFIYVSYILIIEA